MPHAEMKFNWHRHQENGQRGNDGSQNRQLARYGSRFSKTADPYPRQNQESERRLERQGHEEEVPNAPRPDPPKDVLSIAVAVFHFGRE